MTDQLIDRPGGTLDSEVLDLASRIFDMARRGDAATLAAYLDAGAPVNLTNTSGDTLVMLAAYYGHESTVAALIARGGDVMALELRVMKGGEKRLPISAHPSAVLPDVGTSRVRRRAVGA